MFWSEYEGCSGIMSLGIPDCYANNVTALFVSAQYHLNSRKYPEQDEIGLPITYRREKYGEF
jgi:hypothetical protein